MMWRSRWAAVGAAIAVTLGAGGIGLVEADKGSGERPVTVTIDPCRLRDTRPDRGIGGRTTPLGPAEAYTVWGTGPSGNCNIPGDATGLVLNVTADQASEATNLRLYPTGSSVPTTSNLNPRPGAAPTPNAVTVGLDGSGRFDIRNAKGSVHVIIDVTAYLVHHTHDDRYVSSVEDTFYYVPGSLLKVHWEDGPATVLFDDSSDAIVRKTGAQGYMRVVIPIPLPAELGGEWGKLVNFRVSYRVDNTNSYITHTWLNNTNNTGGHVELANDSTDQDSTAFTSYVVDCAGPGCQLGWVPNGNYLTVVLGLQFGGIGSAHDINIGGVMMRVSYDG